MYTEAKKPFIHERQQPMINSPVEKNHTPKNWITNLGWHLAIPIGFLLFMALFFPLRERMGNTDEGINLMKGMLVMKGYGLYDEIWSDQPPLFTHLLVAVFQTLGMRVGSGRLLVLIFSILLLWAGVQFMRQVWGGASALAFALLLVILPHYLSLSADVKIGLPAISLAMLSLLALAGWHRHRRDRYLILSGVMLGLSTLTKLFTGILVPIFGLGIIISEFTFYDSRERWRQIFRAATIWGFSLAGTILALGLILIGPGNVLQLLEPHLIARQVEAYLAVEEYTLIFQLQNARYTLVLAVIGSIFILITRRWLSLYLVAWSLVAYLFLADHTPVWEHQQMLVTIPAVMLAAIAVGEMIRSLSEMIRSRTFRNAAGILSIATLISLVIVIVIQTPDVRDQLKAQPSWSHQGLMAKPEDIQILEIMESNAGETRWVVTDFPIYAFMTGLPAPPNLAVFSSKRVATENLTEAEVLDTILEYEPRQVLLGRFQLPGVEAYLDEHYNLVHRRHGIRLYLQEE